MWVRGEIETERRGRVMIFWICTYSHCMYIKLPHLHDPSFVLVHYGLQEILRVIPFVSM